MVTVAHRKDVARLAKRVVRLGGGRVVNDQAQPNQTEPARQIPVDMPDR